MTAKAKIEPVEEDVVVDKSPQEVEFVTRDEFEAFKSYVISNAQGL